MNSSTRNLEDVAASLKQFTIADYSVFIAMLVCCSCVGVYVAWDEYRRRKLTKNVEQGCETDNYLMGGRNMQVFPVGEFSLFNSMQIRLITLHSDVSDCKSRIGYHASRHGHGNLFVRHTILLHIPFDLFVGHISALHNHPRAARASSYVGV